MFGIVRLQVGQNSPDKESYVLLWKMLVLLLRQKGQVEGSDLAELLLRSRFHHDDHLRKQQRGHCGQVQVVFTGLE